MGAQQSIWPGGARDSERRFAKLSRLRDCLVEADRQWPVKVCIGLDLDRHELVPRDLGHCVEDSIVQSGFADLGGEMSRDRSNRCNHLPALIIEKFYAHERP